MIERHGYIKVIMQLVIEHIGRESLLDRKKHGKVSLSAIISTALWLLVLVPAVYASDEQSGLGPVIPEAKGDRCVEPTEVMRRQHHQFILHQRDETVHRGVRTKKYRFTRCIDCHVQPTATGDFPRHGDDNHFCTACHRYSSVSIDCFQCHADRPEQAYSTTKPNLNALSGMKQRRSGLSLQFIQQHLNSDER